jgi:hypothetical protein
MSLRIVERERKSGVCDSGRVEVEWVGKKKPYKNLN